MTSGVTKLSKKKWKKWLRQIIPLSPTHIRELAVTCHVHPVQSRRAVAELQVTVHDAKAVQIWQTQHHVAVPPGVSVQPCEVFLQKVGQGIKFTCQCANHQKAPGVFPTFLLGGAAFIFSRVFSYEDCTFHRWVFPSQKRKFHSHTHRDVSLPSCHFRQFRWGVGIGESYCSYNVDGSGIRRSPTWNV